jgi:membrane-bound serine protease (ClpP class)
MARLLGALVLGLALWSLAASTSAMEPTGRSPTVVAAQIDGVVDASVPRQSLAPIEIALKVIADPNVAFLLLILGMVGIVAELYHPGAFVPGIAGAISLLLAFVGLGNLPTNWGAVALLGLSLVLFLLELHLPSHGILGAGGAIAFLLGGLLLFASPTPVGPVFEAIAVNRWLLLSAGATFAAFFLLALRAGLRARRMPVFDSLEHLPGALGIAASSLAPGGTVLVLNEAWSAVSDGGTIEPGEEVEVVAREGLTLRVRRMASGFVREFETLPSQGEVRPGVWVERA